MARFASVRSEHQATAAEPRGSGGRRATLDVRAQSSFEVGTPDGPQLRDQLGRLNGGGAGHLILGCKDDPAEMEADRAASAAVGASGVNRISTGPSRSSNFDAENAVPPSVYGTLRLPGHPLEPSFLSEMEASFGTGFGHVRIHSDAAAAQSAAELGANAFAIGDHIAFGPGRYETASLEGRRLIAHELAHVAQQRGGDGARVVRRSAGPPPIPQKLPGYLTDEQLAKRAEEIFERMMDGIAKRPRISEKAVERLRQTFTVGVLQAHKDGKLVTMVAVNTSEHLDLLKGVVGDSAEIIDPIEFQKMHARFERPTTGKRWRGNVHSEQVLAGEATERGLIASRVGTSRPGCRKQCISTLDEFYPHVKHVNPAGSTKKVKPRGGGPHGGSGSKGVTIAEEGLATGESKALTKEVKSVAAAEEARGAAHAAESVSGGAKAVTGESKALKAGIEALELGEEARKAGIGAKAVSAAFKGLEIAGHLAEAFIPDPLDVLGLWIDFFGSLAEAKEKLRQEGYMIGFCLGVSAKLLGLEDAEAAQMILYRSTPSVGERVAGWEGVRDSGRFQGAKAGWALWRRTNEAQRKILLDMRRPFIKARRKAIGPDASLTFGFSEVLALALALQPTMQDWLRRAAEEQRRREKEEEERREFERREASWRYEKM